MYNFKTWCERNLLEFDGSEFNPPAGMADDESMAKLKELLGTDYESFVKQLGNFIKDPKFLLALQVATSNGEKAQLKPMAIPVVQLKPTQNEIALHNSLDFPLKNASIAGTYLKGGSVLVKGPIITGGGGQFIIDGHHRWSQLYVVNPSASIQAIDISNIQDPETALKAVQIGIAAAKGSIPTSSAEGSANLLKIDQQTLTSYVLQNIKPDVVAIFQQYMGNNQQQQQQPPKPQQSPPMPQQQQQPQQPPNPNQSWTPKESFYHFYQRMLREVGEQQPQQPQQMQQGNDEAGKQQVAELIWKNVAQMMQNNQPLSPAANRDLMPQTGDAKGWEKKTAASIASGGEQENAHHRPRGKLIKEWQALAGITPPLR